MQRWDATAASPSRKIGQVPICWDPDRDAAVERAHQQFRWFAGGWKVNAELPGTAGFAGATTYVRPDDVSAAIVCGPDVGALVESVRPFVEAGFTDVALVQVGDERQRDFLSFAEAELVPALRDTCPAQRWETVQSTQPVSASTSSGSTAGNIATRSWLRPSLR